MYQVRSYAKVNLGLEIEGKRPDGYHELKTIFQTIDLYDTLYIRENYQTKIILKGDTREIDWGEENTIRRMFRLIYTNFNLTQGFEIEVKKNIPPGAGLGGGSSNAAVVLLFLVKYFGLKISFNEQIQMCARIGADVPFFLSGGTVMATGIGEKICPLDDLPQFTLGLFIPDIKVSTGLVFSRFSLTTNQIDSKISTFLKKKDFKILENNLEMTTFHLFPAIRKIKAKMMSNTDDPVLMSGSGSCLYTIGDEEKLRSLKNKMPGLIITKSLNKAEYRKNIIGAWPSGKASVFGADMRRFESSRPRGK